MSTRFEIQLNGEPHVVRGDARLVPFIESLKLRPGRVAVEINHEVVPKANWAATVLRAGDTVEIVNFVGGGEPRTWERFRARGSKMKDDKFELAGRVFKSRLIVGTGKYRDFAETKAAVEASGAEIVTVAVRRVNITDANKENLLDYIDPKRYQILPNTAGCYTVEDAVRTCRLAREAGVGDMVKLEVIGDDKTLFPDVIGTVEAAKILVKEGFKVLPYITDDPVTCLRLAEIGCAAVMPLAAPIGSGMGIRNPFNLRIILEQAKVPVIVDAGVGTASDAAEAMELGCDGLLVNSAIAGAKDPIAMARAMKMAVEAGRIAYLAGRIEQKLYATASSPLSGLIR